MSEADSLSNRRQGQSRLCGGVHEQWAAEESALLVRRAPWCTGQPTGADGHGQKTPHHLVDVKQKHEEAQ